MSLIHNISQMSLTMVFEVVVMQIIENSHRILPLMLLKCSGMAYINNIIMTLMAKFHSNSSYDISKADYRITF